MSQSFSFPLQFEIDVHDMVALKSADPGIGITPDGEWIGVMDMAEAAHVSLTVLQLIHRALDEIGPRYGFRMVGGSTQVGEE